MILAAAAGILQRWKLPKQKNLVGSISQDVSLSILLFALVQLEAVSSARGRAGLQNVSRSADLVLRVFQLTAEPVQGSRLIVDLGWPLYLRYNLFENKCN